jgi:diguanylate cyclase (GGDEF)-like protein
MEQDNDRTVSMSNELEMLTSINELSKKLNSTLELSQIITFTMREMPAILKADKCSIFLYDVDHDELHLASHNHFDLDQQMDIRISTKSNSLLAQAFNLGKSILIKDIEKEFGFKNRAKYKSKSSMITMLKSGDQPLGIININDKLDGSEFNEWDFSLAQNINEHLATAVSNALLFAQTRRLSITDGLTELYTHRYFQETMEREIGRSRRYGKPLALMMVDIDHFKNVNDTYGHQAGDYVLQGLAQMMRKQFRQSDYACRYGGEEFAVILTDTPLENAVMGAERLRKSMESQVFEFCTSHITVTISIGLSGYREHMSKQEMIEAADQALYRAKRSGRNRVERAD